MNKILVSVIVVVALLGLVGSIMVIPGRDSIPGSPTVTISPTSGPSGTLVQVVATGFSPNTAVSVVVGPQSSLSWDVAFTEVAQGTTDANGVFTVEVPAQGAPGVDLSSVLAVPGVDLLFVVIAEGGPGVHSLDLFHITG